MPRHTEDFDRFFETAVGEAPFPFQRRFAEDPLPQLVEVPTGLGKTAMAVVGWLYRRFSADEHRRKTTPRRLVYCLPMRVLVEQAARNARTWIDNLTRAGCLEGTGPPVHLLMGGEEEQEWDVYPEREVILVGTQDMLLSRALNRGYAASRSRWPMHFGLLNTDCLWVFDEIQLMGAGLATSVQLQAFRQLLAKRDSDAGKPRDACLSVWMSATLDEKWLETVDFKAVLSELLENARLRFDYKMECESPGIDPKARTALEQRWKATKPLSKMKSAIGNPSALADEVQRSHNPGTRTLVVVNTVKRARELFDALLNGSRAAGKSKTRRRTRGGELPSETSPDPAIPMPRPVLLHSRFRPPDRAQRVSEALAHVDPAGPGTIVVSTQVIEAGVDVSAATLVTELAPWPSLVQRFGRCNRRGEHHGRASVHWIDLPANADAEKLRHPYELADLRAAVAELKRLKDVGLGSLDAHRQGLSAEMREILFPHQHTHVIRRKDLLDLFDTTPDLAGNDIDIDRFIREVEESDVHVFWRAWDQPRRQEPPPENSPAPRREELCPVPIGEFRDFCKDTRRSGKVWRWNFLDGAWEKIDSATISPGQVFLVHADAGGYSTERGWDPNNSDRVPPLGPQEGDVPDATEVERLSQIGVWQTLAEHADEVCGELDAIVGALPLSPDEEEALGYAARWHDRGKAHEVFQQALPEGVPEKASVWAKAAGKWNRYTRRHFRHELASALAVLMASDGLVPPGPRDLVAYLVAAHHGKVRLSIRSLPDETRPDSGKRFARGIWDGDPLPATDLGGGVTAPAVTLSLEPMELGLGEDGPFAGQRSWADRMIRLRDDIGAFRLAYLEAILRAADMRASRAANRRAADASAEQREVPGG